MNNKRYKFLLLIVSGIILLVTVGISSHGFVGTFLSMERAVYCTASEVIMRSECPDRSEPITRSAFNIDVFKDLSQTRNYAQLFFFIILAIVAISTIAVAMVSLVMPYAVSFGYMYALQRYVPPDFVLRMKLRRWSRQLAQSPALLRA